VIDIDELKNQREKLQAEIERQEKDGKAQAPQKSVKLPPQEGGHAYPTAEEVAADAVAKLAQTIEAGILDEEKSISRTLVPLVGDALKRPGKDRNMKMIGKFYAIRQRLGGIRKTIDEAMHYIDELVESEIN
jgi:hypothetical protein